MVVIAVAWFICVDWSWFIDRCPACDYECEITQYRICGFPVREQTRTYHSIQEHVTRDLGITCSHPQMVYWHKHRWWGLSYCACPCWNGIYRLTGDDSWYDATIQARIQALAKADPSIRDEFRRKIMADQDSKWWKEFWRRVNAMPAPAARSPW